MNLVSGLVVLGESRQRDVATDESKSKGCFLDTRPQKLIKDFFISE